MDIVASDQPEALRALLGDGSRWGMRLRWHFAADPARPYGVLRSLHLQPAQRLVIGHADSCPSVDVLPRLRCTQAWALYSELDRDPCWSGWASLPSARLTKLPPDMGVDELARAIGEHAVPPVLWTSRDLTILNGSEAQLRAAHTLGRGQGDLDVPASWVRTRWGAMSPLARVHPQARLNGPLRIGPGCVVDRNAELGPDVVLSRIVWVSGGTTLSRCVVLPDSYLGAGLELVDAVINGSRVCHVGLGVGTTLPTTDALLLALKPDAPAASSVLPRLLAAFAWLLVLPVIESRRAVRRWMGRAPDWRTVSIVTGRDEGSLALKMAELRCAPPGSEVGHGSAWAVRAGLKELAAGRRNWFGSRPWGRSHWYALRPEWRTILSRTHRKEACAAADVHLAVQPSHRRALTVLRGLMRSR